jgi:site-specific DNA-methyltransferase (adenine-specific)
MFKKEIMHRSNIEILNIDCLPFMRGCADKKFDLAIVDPPYGINRGGQPETFTKSIFKRQANA